MLGQFFFLWTMRPMKIHVSRFNANATCHTPRKTTLWAAESANSSEVEFSVPLKFDMAACNVRKPLIFQRQLLRKFRWPVANPSPTSWQKLCLGTRLQSLTFHLVPLSGKFYYENPFVVVYTGVRSLTCAGNLQQTVCNVVEVTREVKQWLGRKTERWIMKFDHTDNKEPGY